MEMKKNQDNIDTDKLKGVLVTRTAIKTLVDEDIVEKIISFQFKDVREMAHEHIDIELAAFGTFKISGRKLKLKIHKMKCCIVAWEKRIEEGIDVPEARMKYWVEYLAKNRKVLEFLKQKETEYEDKY